MVLPASPLQGLLADKTAMLKANPRLAKELLAKRPPVKPSLKQSPAPAPETPLKSLLKAKVKGPTTDMYPADRAGPAKAGKLEQVAGRSFGGSVNLSKNRISRPGEAPKGLPTCPGRPPQPPRPGSRPTSQSGSLPRASSGESSGSQGSSLSGSELLPRDGPSYPQAGQRSSLSGRSRPLPQDSSVMSKTPVAEITAKSGTPCESFTSPSSEPPKGSPLLSDVTPEISPAISEVTPENPFLVPNGPPQRSTSQLQGPAADSFIVSKSAGGFCSLSNGPQEYSRSVSRELLERSTSLSKGHLERCGSLSKGSLESSRSLSKDPPEDSRSLSKASETTSLQPKRPEKIASSVSKGPPERFPSVSRRPTERAHSLSKRHTDTSEPPGMDEERSRSLSRKSLESSPSVSNVALERSPSLSDGHSEISRSVSKASDSSRSSELKGSLKTSGSVSEEPMKRYPSLSKGPLHSSHPVSKAPESAPGRAGSPPPVVGGHSKVSPSSGKKTLESSTSEFEEPPESCGSSLRKSSEGSFVVSLSRTPPEWSHSLSNGRQRSYYSTSKHTSRNIIPDSHGATGESLVSKRPLQSAASSLNGPPEFLLLRSRNLLEGSSSMLKSTPEVSPRLSKQSSISFPPPRESSRENSAAQSEASSAHSPVSATASQVRSSGRLSHIANTSLQAAKPPPEAGSTSLSSSTHNRTRQEELQGNAFGDPKMQTERTGSLTHVRKIELAKSPVKDTFPSHQAQRRENVFHYKADSTFASHRFTSEKPKRSKASHREPQSQVSEGQKHVENEVSAEHGVAHSVGPHPSLHESHPSFGHRADSPCTHQEHSQAASVVPSVPSNLPQKRTEDEHVAVTADGEMRRCETDSLTPPGVGRSLEDGGLNCTWPSAGPPAGTALKYSCEHPLNFGTPHMEAYTAHFVHPSAYTGSPSHQIQGSLPCYWMHPVQPPPLHYEVCQPQSPTTVNVHVHMSPKGGEGGREDFDYVSSESDSEDYDHRWGMTRKDRRWAKVPYQQRFNPPPPLISASYVPIGSTRCGISGPSYHTLYSRPRKYKMGNTYSKHYQLPTVSSLLRAAMPEFLRKRPIKIMTDGSGRRVQLDGTLQFEVQLDTEEGKTSPTIANITCNEGQEEEARGPAKEEACSLPSHHLHLHGPQCCSHGKAPRVCLTTQCQIKPSEGPIVSHPGQCFPNFPVHGHHGHHPWQTPLLAGTPSAGCMMNPSVVPLHNHNIHMGLHMTPQAASHLQPYVGSQQLFSVHSGPPFRGNSGHSHGLRHFPVEDEGTVGCSTHGLGHEHRTGHPMWPSSAQHAPGMCRSGICTSPAPYPGVPAAMQPPEFYASSPPGSYAYLHPQNPQKHGISGGPGCGVCRSKMPGMLRRHEVLGQCLMHSAPPGAPYALWQPQMAADNSTFGRSAPSAPHDVHGERHSHMRETMGRCPVVSEHCQCSSSQPATRSVPSCGGGYGDPARRGTATGIPTVGHDSTVEGESCVHGEFRGGGRMAVSQPFKALW